MKVYWPFQDGASFADPFCYLCFMLVFVKPSCLILVALWSPAGRGWPLCSLVCGVLLFCCFPYGVLGQMWCLVASNSDLSLLNFELSSSLYKVFAEKKDIDNKKVSEYDHEIPQSQTADKPVAS